MMSSRHRKSKLSVKPTVARILATRQRTALTLDAVYAHEARLAALYPGNRNVRPKIRQQLQVLRDRGWLSFDGGGRYRRT